MTDLSRPSERTLKDYARHLPECLALGHYGTVIPGEPCTCGLDTLLRASAIPRAQRDEQDQSRSDQPQPAVETLTNAATTDANRSERESDFIIGFNSGWRQRNDRTEADLALNGDEAHYEREYALSAFRAYNFGSATEPPSAERAPTTPQERSAEETPHPVAVADPETRPLVIHKSCTVGATTTNIRLTEHHSAHITEKVGPSREGHERRREIYVPLSLLEVFMGAWQAVDPSLKSSLLDPSGSAPDEKMEDRDFTLAVLSAIVPNLEHGVEPERSLHSLRGLLERLKG